MHNPIDPSRKLPGSGTPAKEEVEHHQRWAQHVAAGRIGGGQGVSPEWRARVLRNEAILRGGAR